MYNILPKYFLIKIKNKMYTKYQYETKTNFKK